MQDYINWWESTKETGLEDVKTTFVNLFSKADFLPQIYYPVLYKYLKNPQIKHWDKELFSFTNEKIREIEKEIGKETMTSTLLSYSHLLIYAYLSILDLEERIMLMNRFRGNEELKAKVFSINIYNDLLNSAFSNILKVFIEFQGVIEKNDKLYQKNLTPQIDCLAKPDRGYHIITDLADSNIRNAISHGDVRVDKNKMYFSYSKGGKYLKQELTVYDFKDYLFKLYDGVSAILLAWFGYFCEENITDKDVYENSLVHEDTSLFFERLSMSTLLTTCDRVFIQKTNNQNGIKTQTNIEFSGIDLDINSRIVFGLFSAQRIFELRKLALEDNIMISFHSPKTVNSFFIVDCFLVNDLINGVIDYERASRIIIDNKNILIGPINDEERNPFEDSFRFYPDIENDDFYLTEVEDISNEMQKRFKAVAYLKRAKRPNHVKDAVEEIVNQLRTLENYGFSSNKVKHGKMDADIIYLVLYKKEVRRGEDRALLPRNKNFIAQIQYDVDMKFPINNSFINKYLKKRRENTIEYNWNPNF